MITLNTVLVLVLVLNLLWFGAAFHFFSLKSLSAAKLLAPRSARESPHFRTIAASVRFLGGMNLAFAVFSVLLLFNLGLFPDTRQLGLFCLVFAVAHGSQFCFNVPMAIGDCSHGESLWPVLSGPMRFIFIVDLALTIINAILCIALFVA